LIKKQLQLGKDRLTFASQTNITAKNTTIIQFYITYVLCFSIGHIVLYL